MNNLDYFIIQCLPELELDFECVNCEFLSEVMQLTCSSIDIGAASRVCELCPNIRKMRRGSISGCEWLSFKLELSRYRYDWFKKVDDWFSVGRVYDILSPLVINDLGVGSDNVTKCTKEDIKSTMPKEIRDILPEIKAIVEQEVIDAYTQDGFKRIVDLIYYRLKQNNVNFGGISDRDLLTLSALAVKLEWDV